MNSQTDSNIHPTPSNSPVDAPSTPPSDPTAPAANGLKDDQLDQVSGGFAVNYENGFVIGL